MQVLVGLVLLIGASQGQQAVSYQNFRASHGQGHPTYRSDGSWSQSFGGRGGRFRLLALPSPSAFASPRPVVYHDQPFPLYDAPPPTNAFLTPQTSFQPAFPPPTSLLPSYSPESQNYNTDPILHSPDPGPTPSAEFSEGPTPQPLESRTEYRPEAQTPQAAYQGPTTHPSQDGRSFQTQNSNSYSGNYQSFEGQHLNSPTPGPTSSPPREFSNANPDYNNGGPNSDYTPISKNPSPTSAYLPNDRDTSSNYGTNSRSPSSDSGPSGNYGSNGGPNSDFSPNNRGPSNNFAPNSRGPVSDYGPTRGPVSDYGPNRGPVSDYAQNRGPSSDYGPNKGPVSDYGPNRGPASDYGPNTGQTSDYNSNERGSSPKYNSNERESSTNYNSNERGPSPNYNSNERGPSPNYNSNERGPSPVYNSNERGPSPNYNSNDRGPGPSYNSHGASSSHGPQGRGPISNYNSPNRGPASDFAPNNRGPNGDYRADSRGYTNGESRPLYDNKRSSPGHGGISNPYNRPLHNNGQPSFAAQNKLPQGHGTPLGSSPLQGGYKPLHPEHRGQNPNSRQSSPVQKGRPNFSGEEGGQSFESDFKSSELGGQSFEVPDFPSDEAYFNSQEGYGSFEGKGFASDEGGGGKDSYENQRNFNSKEKGFTERDSSYESDERAQSGERSDLPNRGAPQPPPNYSPIGLHEDKKNGFQSNDKKGFTNLGDKKPPPDSSPAGEPKPFPGTSYPLYPEKTASLAVEKFVPFDKGYALRRNPSPLESRGPFPAKPPFTKSPPPPITRIYKRKPTGEGIASFKNKNKKVPSKNKEKNNSSD